MKGGVEKGQRRNVFDLWPFLIIYSCRPDKIHFWKKQKEKRKRKKGGCLCLIVDGSLDQIRSRGKYLKIESECENVV